MNRKQEKGNEKSETGNGKNGKRQKSFGKGKPVKIKILTGKWGKEEKGQ